MFSCNREVAGFFGTDTWAGYKMSVRRCDNPKLEEITTFCSSPCTRVAHNGHIVAHRLSSVPPAVYIHFKRGWIHKEDNEWQHEQVGEKMQTCTQFHKNLQTKLTRNSIIHHLNDKIIEFLLNFVCIFLTLFEYLMYCKSI